MTKSNVFVEGGRNRIVPQSFSHWIYIRYTFDFDHSAPYLTQPILIESLVRVWDMNYPVGTAIDHLRPCVYSALHFGGKHPFSPIYVALFGQKPKKYKMPNRKEVETEEHSNSLLQQEDCSWMCMQKLTQYICVTLNISFRGQWVYLLSIDTQVSLAPTHVGCKSVSPSVCPWYFQISILSGSLVALYDTVSDHLESLSTSVIEILTAGRLNGQCSGLYG